MGWQVLISCMYTGTDVLYCSQMNSWINVGEYTIYINMTDTLADMDAFVRYISGFKILFIVETYIFIMFYRQTCPVKPQKLSQ